MELKQLILEGQNYYKLYKESKPYIEFSTFLESLKRDNNKSLIESIQTGIKTVLENVNSALKQLHSPYDSWLDKGHDLVDNHPEKIAAAQKDHLKPESRTILIQSVMPVIAQHIDEAMNNWDVYNAKGKSFGDNLSEEAVSRTVSYLYNKLIPKYDPSKGIKFYTFASSALRSSGTGTDKSGGKVKLKSGHMARQIVRELLDVPSIPKWKPESDRGQKYMYEPQNDKIVKKGKVRHEGKVYTRLGPDKFLPDGLGDVPPNDKKVLDEYWIEAASEDTSAFSMSKDIEGDTASEQGGTASTGGSTDTRKVDASVSPETPDKALEGKRFDEKLKHIISVSGAKDPNLVDYLMDYYLQVAHHGKISDEEHNEIATRNNFNLKNNTHVKGLSRARLKVKEKLSVLLEKA